MSSPVSSGWGRLQNWVTYIGEIMHQTLVRDLKPAGRVFQAHENCMLGLCPPSPAFYYRLVHHVLILLLDGRSGVPHMPPDITSHTTWKVLVHVPPVRNAKQLPSMHEFSASGPEGDLEIKAFKNK